MIEVLWIFIVLVEFNYGLVGYLKNSKLRIGLLRYCRRKLYYRLKSRFWSMLFFFEILKISCFI